MKNKHTAGEWKIYDTCLPARGIMEIQSDGKVIANVKRLVTGKCYAASQCPEAEANAKLIAAAPKLLEALKYSLGLFKEYNGMKKFDLVIDHLESAIKEATGN